MARRMAESSGRRHAHHPRRSDRADAPRAVARRCLAAGVLRGGAPRSPLYMSGPLVFMMGKFAAEFPTDRRYAKNHMWVERRGDCVRFGFAACAVRLLQDVYFLDWSVEAGIPLAERQEIGSIESKKAESSLYAPIA